jgi:hypothetical protein
MERRAGLGLTSFGEGCQELAAGFGNCVGDGGEAGEFGVDELVDYRDGGRAFVAFPAGFLAFDA